MKLWNCYHWIFFFCDLVPLSCKHVFSSIFFTITFWFRLCNYPQVSPDVHFQKDLGLDSLDSVEIVMALEEEFKLEIPDKEADKIDSCNLAIEYIYNHPMAG